jgi:hypothetical protein
VKKKTAVKAAAPLMLDLGCGKNKKPGFLGVDVLKFEGVDVVCDLGKKKWPWKDGSVDEIHASHFVEHLTPTERIHFTNEAYRVMRFGARITIITPHWCASRAYGDLTHQWPPVSEFWFYYLNKAWRAVNAPHNQTYTCDFDPPAGGYTLHSWTQGRAPEVVNFATSHYKEICQDSITVLTKSERKPVKK